MYQRSLRACRCSLSTGEEIVKFGASHHAEGDAYIDPQLGMMSISNMGAASGGGLTITRDAWDALSLEIKTGLSSVPIGSKLAFLIQAKVEGVSDQSAGTLTLERKVGPKDLEVAVDFGVIGSQQALLEAYHNGVLKLQVVVPAGVLGYIDVAPNVLAELGGAVECFVIKTPPQVFDLVTSQGLTPVLADELRILSTSSGSLVAGKSAASLTASGIDSMEILGEFFSAYCVAGVLYGAGCVSPTSGMTPIANGEVCGGDSVTIALNHGIAGSPAILAVSPFQALIPIGAPGCSLLVGPTPVLFTAPLTIGPTGGLFFGATLPPTTAGTTFHLQWLMFDPAAGYPISSNGLTLHVAE